MYKGLFKRILDIIISFVGLIIFSPILVFVTCLLIIYNNGSVFYIQNRPGKDGKTFNLIKLKTMTDTKNQDGILLPDSERLTKVGIFIRSFSIDEIPQLVNVIKGDMSIVGPRPLLVEYLPFYSSDQSKRHNLRPGITGWAQINGRNAITWKQKFEYDVWYVENVSLVLDIKIMFLTLKKVIFREGISSKTSLTMEPFKGE